MDPRSVRAYPGPRHDPGNFKLFKIAMVIRNRPGGFLNPVVVREGPSSDRVDPWRSGISGLVRGGLCWVRHIGISPGWFVLGPAYRV